MRTRLDAAAVIAMDSGRRVIAPGSLLIDGDTIAGVAANAGALPAADRVVDLSGCALLPGFVQSHVHGCQTLMRGAADDLPLLEWLRRRVWPLEAAHDEASVAASMRLTALELLKGGTTAMLSMETVRHTDAAFAALDALPLRAVVGKCLMDRGDGAPPALIEAPRRALDAALALAKARPHRKGARLRACLAPRFAVACSEGLLRDVGAAAAAEDLLVHTHASEQIEEVELVEKLTGRRNLTHLAHVGLLSDRLRVAHCVHLDDAEVDALARSGAHVLHCPSSNLKLGSGIAPIARYLERGIAVSLGADGAPCNNNLDGLREARLAALLQKPRFGPAALPAPVALELLTIRGAAALGMADEIGSLEPGKQADVVAIDLEGAHAQPAGDACARVVYACERSDLRMVFVAGQLVVERGRAFFCDETEVVASAKAETRKLFARAGLTA